MGVLLYKVFTMPAFNKHNKDNVTFHILINIARVGEVSHRKATYKTASY